MENNRRYSFFQLFTKGITERPGNYKLVIPIIQRDYAQGRDNDKANEVRHDFLNQLFDYMTAECGGHDLDFVYGTTSSATDLSRKKEFRPLDGQQRLTTLFLIHLYLALRTKDTEESKLFFKTMQVKNGKLTESLFSYRTRTSAVEFCNGLIDDSYDYTEVFELNPATNERVYKSNLSDYIRNSNWFYPDWVQDPTVSGMLTMLDAIDKRFDGHDHLFILKRLMSDSDPSITFIFMNLEDYKLTDDLYIKMNSRGKPLTPFENFKAKYEQYISWLEKEGGSEALRALHDDIVSRNNPVIKTVKDNFAFNIDSKWAILFWKYSREEIKNRESKIKDNEKENEGGYLDRLLSETLDLKISRFITMVFVNQFAMDHNTGREGIPRELVDMKLLSFAALSKMDALSPEGVVLMTRMFELYSDRPLSIMPEWSRIYFDENEVFNSLISGKEFTFTKRFLLYAYLRFRLEFEDDVPEYLVEWMRFLYNMTLDDNSIQDITRITYRNAILSVNNLLGLIGKLEKPSIVTLLSSEEAPTVVDFFPDYQYKEEVLKSALFSKDSKNALHSADSPDIGKPLEDIKSWGKIILKLESHPYFTGQIGFILKMAGISDYFKVHNDLNWSESDDSAYKDKMIWFGKLASMVFNGGYTRRSMAKNALFERAMLAKHPEYLGHNLLNSTNKSAGSNNLLRDVSWKSYLRLDAGRPEIQDMVRNLLLVLDADDPEKSLRSIVENNNEGTQWRKDIVRYGYLMGKSQNGYFGSTEDGHRILNDRIQFSRGDHEVYSFVLYNEYILKKSGEFKNLGFWTAYGNSNSWSEIPFVKISDDDITVKVKSYVDKDSGELICHYLWIDSDGNQELERFLEDRGFTKKAQADTVYRRRHPDWDCIESIDDYRNEVADSAITFINELSSFLNEDSNGQQ
ncbi:MAG: DUF262 domain-containing protein [Bacteroidales bacterium]|nr:DUF262 domain-containing protein [Bacteroidales bacterium]